LYIDRFVAGTYRDTVREDIADHAINSDKPTRNVTNSIKVCVLSVQSHGVYLSLLFNT